MIKMVGGHPAIATQVTLERISASTDSDKVPDRLGVTVLQHLDEDWEARDREAVGDGHHHSRLEESPTAHRDFKGLGPHST